MIEEGFARGVVMVTSLEEPQIANRDFSVLSIDAFDIACATATGSRRAATSCDGCDELRAASAKRLSPIMMLDHLRAAARE